MGSSFVKTPAVPELLSDEVETATPPENDQPQSVAVTLPENVIPSIN